MGSLRQAQAPQPAASLPKASASLLRSGKSKQVRIPIALKITFGAWAIVLGQYSLKFRIWPFTDRAVF